MRTHATDRTAHDTTQTARAATPGAARRWHRRIRYAWAALLFAVPAMAGATTIYIPMGGSNRIQLVDTARAAVTGRIPGIVNAHGLAITPDGRYLIAPSADSSGCSGASAAHDAHQGKPCRSSGKPVATAPTIGPSTVEIIRTSDLQVVSRVPFSTASHHIAASPNGRYAVVTHRDSGDISIIDIAQAADPAVPAAVRNVHLGGHPAYAVVSADSRTIYVSDMMGNSISLVDAGSGAVTDHIPVRGGPWHMTLSPDGRYLYTANVKSGSVARVSARQRRVVATYEVGGTLHGISIADSGKRLFVADMAGSRLVVLDLSTGARRILRIPAAFHVTTVPGSDRIAVTSLSKPDLWLISATSLRLAARIPIGGFGHQIAVASPRSD